MYNIVIIEPSSSGLELLPAIKALRYNTIVLSANLDDRIIPNYYRKFIDYFYITDTYNTQLSYSILNKVNQINPIATIIPGSEYHVPIVSELSALMNLPGVMLQYVDNLRIKSKMRLCLKNQNIRSVLFAIIGNDKDILPAIQVVGFPCVIKPIASAGSMHVSRVNCLQELTRAYQKMCRDTWTELGIGLGTTAIIEEYINGEEYSVEGYIENSKANIISITQKILSPEPFFIEMGHIVPANIEDKRKIIIQTYIQETIKALNINLGVFHAELKIDNQGPVLIEIAGRLPGDRIPDLIQIAKSINFYEIMIKSHLGLPIEVNQGCINQFAGILYFSLNKKNIFKCCKGYEKLSDLPGFHQFTLIKKPGEFIPDVKNFIGRIAYCIFKGNTYNQIKSAFDLANSIVVFD